MKMAIPHAMTHKPVTEITDTETKLIICRKLYPILHFTGFVLKTTKTGEFKP